VGWDVQWLIPDVERRLAHLQSERGAVSDWLVGEGVSLSLSLSLSLSRSIAHSLSLSHTLSFSPPSPLWSAWGGRGALHKAFRVSISSTSFLPHYSHAYC